MFELLVLHSFLTTSLPVLQATDHDFFYFEKRFQSFDSVACRINYTTQWMNTMKHMTLHNISTFTMFPKLTRIRYGSIITSGVDFRSELMALDSVQKNSNTGCIRKIAQYGMLIGQKIVKILTLGITGSLMVATYLTENCVGVMQIEQASPTYNFKNRTTKTVWWVWFTASNFSVDGIYFIWYK